MSVSDPARPAGAARFGILISGRGSNMEALIDAALAGTIPATPAVVIANLPDAAGLEKARDRGVPTAVVEHRSAPSREAHERAVLEVLRQHRVELVCLAGYMRLLSAVFLEAFPRRVLNIHPSLLPAFPGLEAAAQAVRHGVRVSGCTVHFVDPGLDQGPIVLQAAVEVRPEDTPAQLARRILEQEHRIYVEAVRLFCEGRLRIDGRRVRITPLPGT